METNKIKKGDIVEILEEYQDEVDKEFVWVAISDEEKGRVTITPMNSKMTIKPTYVRSVEHLR